MIRKSTLYLFAPLFFMVLWVGIGYAQDPTPLPEIHIVEMSHDYGYAKVGHIQEWVMRVANRGLGQLIVADIVSNNPDFFITDPESFPQDVSYSGGRNPDSLFVTVAFSPSLYGAIEGTLTVISNDTDEGTLHVALGGIGASPEIEVSHVSHDFGDVLLGDFSSWIFTLYNGGPVDLYVSNVFSNDLDFIVSDSFPNTIPTGDSLDVTVIFEPSVEGGAFATLTIQSDDVNNQILFINVVGVGTVPQPDIVLSSTFHNYGSFLIGESLGWQLNISNTGLAALTVHSIHSDHGDFSIVSPAFPQTILSGGDMDVEVSFTPSTVGAIVGTLDVSSNDPDEGLLEIVVVGSGIAGPSPDIEVSLPSYNFGSVVVGSTRVVEVCVSNLGTAYLVVDSIVSNMPAFSADPTLFTVSPGGSDCFSMRFTPNALGIISGIVTIHSNDPDESQVNIFVNGTGVPVSEPDIQLSAGSHQYGEVLVGTSSLWTLTITNVGILDLTVFSITSNHANFTVISPVFPQTVSSGQDLNVTVAFQPTSEGPKSATLTIYTNDSDEEILTVPLNGNGVLIAEADIELSEDSHGFGNVEVGSSANWTLTITNVGAMPLTVNSVVSDRNDFTVVSPAFPQILGAGGHVDVVINFSPLSVGAKPGVLTITSDDPDEGTRTVLLSGTGLPISGEGPDISISANSYDYGTVVMGTSEDWIVQIYNMGVADLVVSSITSNNADFDVVYPPFPQTIPPSGHVGVVLSFSPSSATYITGTLTIFSNDPDEGTVSVYLSGSGIPGEGPDIELLTVLDFGGVILGNTADRTLTVCNVGSDPLVLFSMDADLGVFGIALPTFPDTIPATGCVEVTVTFTPDSPEPVLGHLTISSNDPDEGVLSVTLTGRGISEGVGDIQLSALQHDYRFVMLESSADWVLDIENMGSTTLTIQSITSDNSDFVITTPASFPQLVSPGHHLIVVVTFTPSSLGAITGMLSVQSNDPDESLIEVALSGRGVIAPLPDIEVSESTYDFGEVIVGTTTEWSMLIYNRGSDSLIVYSATPGHSDFNVLSPIFPQKIAPDDSLTVTVAFTPSSAGVVIGNLVIVNDDPDEDEWTLSVAVRGTGILVPDISLSKIRHDFGDVSIGHFGDWELLIYNFGSVNLSVDDVSSNHGDFTVTFPTFPQEIPPGEHLHVVVTFVPTSEGLITGTLTVHNDDPDESLLTVTLLGTGIVVPTPDINFSTITVDFGSIAIGESTERTFTIYNVGTADLTLFAVVSEHQDFTITEPAFPVVLGPSHSLEVTVGFAPLAEGMKNGSLTVNSSDPDEGSVSVFVSGVALPLGTWSLALTLQSSNIVVAPVTLGVGAHPDGSICFNPDLDTPSPPPAPSTPFDAYIPCIGLFTRLATDIQSSDSTTLVWTINTHGTGGVISWNPQNLPSGGIFTLNNVVDMRYRTSMDFFSGAQLTLVYTRLEPGVNVSVTDHDFGEVKLGKSRDWVFTVRSVGDVSLVLSDVLSDNQDFEVSYPLQFPQAVSMGESLDVVVTFRPSVVGPRSGVLTLVTNDLGEPMVPLTVIGTGVYPGAWQIPLILQSTNLGIAPTTLVCGVDPEAGNDFDSQVDQPSPPPVPGVEFEAYFPATGLFPRLSTDIRSSYDLIVTWHIVTAGTGGTITWNPLTLPPDGSFTMNETMNMRFVNSLTFQSSDTLTIVYRVEAIPEMTCSVLLQGYYTMGNRDSVVIELRDSRISIAHSFKVFPDQEGLVQLPVPEGSYYVLVDHRNHLPVMTNARYSFAPGMVTIDFTSPGVAYKPEPGSPDPVYTENDGRRSLRGGDANGDGVVNILDFALFARANGSTESPPSSNWDRRADFDGTRVINIFDFQVFGLNNGMVTYVPYWSPPSSRGTAYPGPSAKATDEDPVDFSFSANTNNPSQGDAIAVDVVLTPTSELTIFGIDAYVQYDPDVFEIPVIEDYLTPAATYGWAFEHVNMKYDTSAVIETLYAVQYSKGTTSGPGWLLNMEGVPYRLTLRVKDDAPGGETEISFRPQFANVLDDQLQPIPVNVSSYTFTITVTGVFDPSSPVLPSEYTLSQNYPNPFNPETEIQYALPEAGFVRLDVYNILGQKIVTLVEEEQEAGYKSVTWSGQDERNLDLSSGIYFYTLRVGRFTDTRKMILTK
ncbi:MAG: choice-of-anchor D domain-containing protein [Gemmatimonadota bacterium]|nr:MAG: choice-of-anchor D domain-containing protein [Gemmatimonadota bacterium]